MSTQPATIVLHLDGLLYRAPRDHPATALVRALPHRAWTGNGWLIALQAANVPGLRRVYQLGVAFSDDAIASLKNLKSPHAEAVSRPPQVMIAPEIVPSCRQLEASTHP